MNKVGDWLNSLPLSGTVTVSFIIGTLYGKQFSHVSWETLAAGILGLTGGAFAWFAAKAQIKSQNQHRLDEIQRVTVLGNRRFYLKSIRTAEIAYGIAANRRFLIDDKLNNGGIILTLQSQFRDFKFEDPPLTLEDDITNKTLDLQRIHQRIVARLSAYEFCISKHGNLNNIPINNLPEKSGLIHLMQEMENTSLILQERCHEMLQKTKAE